jgi:hypothetical protein
MADQNPDDLLDVAGVAEVCDVSIWTVKFWRKAHTGPLPVKGGGNGRKLTWRRSTVDAWRLANQPQRPPIESDYQTVN